MKLPDLARKLIDNKVFGTLSTVNPNGGPQSSVIWVKRDGDNVIFSTIEGRRKTKNMARDPRVSLMLFDPTDPYSYAEIRGTVTMNPEGGPELIQELSFLYEDRPFHEHSPDNKRLVCTITPDKVVTR
ncbi:PPOX class F420-dependent oxidoreductase [Catelliglobosispora koreensis]|uniref:PPOX class F420-dependent oxidoreductase n=1 Tax=Catelliglobosispora koreensis TaxID=129052 RepID=UPI0003725499|nr:PPOX class F420-dependent oxidoreductase [Catelliglobosispora koreensis]